MKYFLTLIIFLFPVISTACPGCAGSMDNPKEVYKVYVLMGFILGTYIPFYLIYSTIFKNKSLNNKLNKK